EDYVQSAVALDAVEGIPAVELNVSCPNVHWGCEFAADVGLLTELIKAVRAVLARKRLFVKLSPVATGRPSLVESAKEAVGPGGAAAGPNQRPGADALCISNTIPAMAIDVETRKPRLANVTGGLSGPALHPVAVKLVHDVYRGVARESKTPIV